MTGFSECNFVQKPSWYFKKNFSEKKLRRPKMKDLKKIKLVRIYHVTIT